MRGITKMTSHSENASMSSSTSPPAIGPTPEPEPEPETATAPQSAPPPKTQGNGYAENGVSDLDDKEPVLPLVLHIEDWDNFGDMDKYRKYEADYTRRLMSKYFSKQTLYGGDVFEERVTIDGEVIQSSRRPCTRSYADPVNSFHEMRGNSMNSVLETNSGIANGKPFMKKSG